MNVFQLLHHLEKTQWEKKHFPPIQAPILTRYQLQTMTPPKGDFVRRTSGSTGIPVEVQKTHLSRLWWNATALREVLWHKRDLSQTFAIIRPAITTELYQPTWGPIFSYFGKTGPLYGHPVTGDLNAWLQKIQPGYLFTYPSILETLDLQALPCLKGIKTTGETLHQSSPLIRDTYSCEEVGTIALQCPDNLSVYHVMENIVLEILDEKDQPAQEGRVVVTDLTSHYLHRYDIGDYAELGSCDCGRGLQTLRKIKGRRRNMVTLPNGTRHWPLIGSLEYRKIAPIKRYQVIQVDATTLEFRLIIDHPLTPCQQDSLTKTIQSWIGYPFTIHFVYVTEFPAGKFEEFVNHSK